MCNACVWVCALVCMHVCVCDMSLCLVAREAGGWDSDREGKMETNTTFSHGCRHTGNPSCPFLHIFSSSSSFPLPLLSPYTILLSFQFPFLFLFPIFLPCRQLCICSSLLGPSSGYYELYLIRSNLT